MNSSTSRWVDVVDLVKANDVKVINGAAEPRTEEFLRAMDQYKERTESSTAGNHPGLGKSF